jgi:hypothetical protein
MKSFSCRNVVWIAECVSQRHRQEKFLIIFFVEIIDTVAQPFDYKSSVPIIIGRGFDAVDLQLVMPKQDSDNFFYSNFHPFPKKISVKNLFRCLYNDRVNFSVWWTVRDLQFNNVRYRSGRLYKIPVQYGFWSVSSRFEA